MKTARSLAWMSGVLLLVWATGCNDPNKDQILQLQDQIKQLTDENADLRSRLAAMTSERDAARQRADNLSRENDRLRGELALANEKARSTPELPEGWGVNAAGQPFIDLGSDLLFDSGKATLRAAGRAKIQQVAAQIQSNFPNMLIWVIGHTDAEPIKASNWKDNMNLSLARGRAVYDELAKLGISRQKLIAGGQGEYNPTAPNDARGRSQMNRRVQIIAVPDAGTRPAGVQDTSGSMTPMNESGT